MTLYCCDENRRQLVRNHAGLNGIDFVEVLDGDLAGVDPLRQRTLLLRFLKPVKTPLAGLEVRILGGERVRDPAVLWLERATPMPAQLDPTIHPEEQGVHDTVAALLHPKRTLVVRTASRGDFSTYQLVLRKPGSEEIPVGIDQLLAEVAFRFKVECPTDLDCQTIASCPPGEAPSPAIDYLARDYPTLRRLVLDRISQLVPDWRERSEADLAVVLAELIAYVADQFSYQLDAIGTEAYLDTCRFRTSLRRHALLVDYHVHEGCNARVWLHLPCRDNAAASGVTLPAGPLRFYSRLPDLPRLIAPGSRADQLALAAKPVVYEAMDSATAITLHPSHNRIELHTWGDSRCCLPAGSTSATLRGHLPTLKEGDPLLFEEVKGPLSGAAADADPRHRHVVRLTAVRAFAAPPSPSNPSGTPLSDPVPTPQDITEVRWGEADALPFPLCLSSLSEQGLPLEAVSVARGNLLLADHGHTQPPEALPEVPASRLSHPPERDGDACAPREPQAIPPRYRPALARGPLTWAAPPPAAKAPASAALTQRLEQVRPAIRLESTRLDAPAAPPETWEPRPDLLRDTGANELAFVVESEADDSARLRFGDDSHGRRPTATLRFEAHYRIGNGRAGLVGADTITHLVGSDPALAFVEAGGVRNPLPAAGALDPEDGAQVRRRAPQAFRRQERAVTPEDYAAVVEGFPGVQRASARLRWTGSWHTMFLTVDRFGGRPIDAPFEQDLRRYLETYRMAGHDLEIEAPVPVPLELTLRVCVSAGHQRAHVRGALQAVLGAERLADGQLGYFHPDRWSFGQTVYLSGIEAAARSVAGVATVQATTFQRQGRPDPRPLQQGYLPLSRLEIATLANNRNHPDRGVLRLDLHGGN